MCLRGSKVLESRTMNGFVGPLAVPEMAKEEDVAGAGQIGLQEKSRRAMESREHLIKGQSLYKEGQVEESVAELREAVRLSPNNTRARSWLGLSLTASGD